MPGRIRTVKPEILEDTKTAKLSHAAWRLFVSGLLLADDYGTLRAEPGQLAGAVFWAAPAEVQSAVQELSDAGLWSLYRVKGQQYAQVRSWSKHQKVNHPGKMRLPGPDEADPPGEALQRVSREPQESLAPPSFLTTTIDLDHRPSTVKREGAAETLRQTTAEVVAVFNREFDRKLDPKGWEDSVRRVLAKGFTKNHLLAVVWWAAEEWADDPDWRKSITPKTLFKLTSSAGNRTFQEYLSLATELWRENESAPPPWEERKPAKAALPAAGEKPQLALVTGDV